MRLIDYLNKGASLGEEAPCLRAGDDVRSYGRVQRESADIARALVASGIVAGDKIAVLSGNDPAAFTCVFAISRAGAVWCPINPRNSARENAEVLNLFDCSALIYHSDFEQMVDEMADDLLGIHTHVCIDRATRRAPALADWVAEAGDAPWRDVATVDDIAMIAGTGGTTGRPKGVLLSERNLLTMTSIMLMSYPFEGRPRYLALAPLTHAAGVLSFPILTLGGEIVIMSQPDMGRFLELLEQRRITHAMLPPTLLYLLLSHERARTTDYSTLQCFWYGSAPMAPARLEEALQVIGPVMAQYFGQTEAPMVLTTMSARDHLNDDGTVRGERLSSAGRAAPLVNLAIVDGDGRVLASGERGEIVARSPLVMPGYYKNEAATREVSEHGWHHTGDIGFLDDDGFLYVVDRAKDMIVTGGFNVYSAEVEQVVMAFSGIQDCAVFGLPDEKWGERVTLVIEPVEGQRIDLDEVRDFLREKLGGVKTPKQIEMMRQLPRSPVGKVLKRDVRACFLPE